MQVMYLIKSHEKLKMYPSIHTFPMQTQGFYISYGKSHWIRVKQGRWSQEYADCMLHAYTVHVNTVQCHKGSL